jgi:acyl carrier protein
MTREQTFATLTDVFRDVFEDDSIVLRENTTADDIADWDSQSHITLILAAEQRFGVKFRTSELDSLKNVGDFVSLIDAKLAQSRR